MWPGLLKRLILFMFGLYLFNSKCVVVPVRRSHPIVVAARQAGQCDPLPIGVYLDGVAFRTPAAGRQDGVLGLWLINLLTSKRFLVSVTLASDACRCGCRGWCSLFPHLHCLSWQIEHLSLGHRPARMWDGSPWPADSLFNAPRDYGFRCALLWVKGDWSEHSKSLGLQPWGAYIGRPPTATYKRLSMDMHIGLIGPEGSIRARGVHPRPFVCSCRGGSGYNAPCQYCALTLNEVHSHYAGLSSEEGVNWPMYNSDDYHDGVARCEIEVDILSRGELLKLDSALKWMGARTMKGKSKNKLLSGRVLTSDITVSGVPLRAGDRLEPSPSLCDIAALAKSAVPIKIVMWRANKDERGRVQDAMNHRCPLFSKALGTAPATTLCVDALHALYFGPVMRWVTAALWRFVLHNVFRYPGPLENIISLGTKAISAELDFWQHTQNIPHANRIGSITPGMLGGRRGSTTQVALFLTL